MTGLKKVSAIEGLRAATASGKSAPLPVPGGQVPAADVPSAKPVRFSLDLDREGHHRYLKRFAFDANTDISHILRALVDEMQTDDGLADRVRERLVR